MTIGKKQSVQPTVFYRFVMNSFAPMNVQHNKGYVPAGHSRRRLSHVAVGLAHALAEQQGYAP